MARGHGRVLSSIWEDSDFLALTEQQQRLYLFLISQPNLNHAGLLPLTLRRWARKAAGLTAADLDKHIQDLSHAEFIVVDDDTEELLIRSFVRNDGVWKQPKVMGAMVSGAMEISSPLLQRALLAEMDRIPLEELSDEPTKIRDKEGPSIRRQVADHIEALRREFGNPSPDPNGGGCEPPSEPPSEAPSATPSGTPSDAPAEEGAEGGPKASTRGRAGASCARTPAPTPSPVPSPIQDGSAEADGQTELVVVTDSDFVGAAEPPAQPELVTANVIVGEWLDRCAKRPPKQTIGRVAKQIKNLLDEEIDPDDIRRGTSLWLAKGADPSAIPSFVNQAMNSRAPRVGNVVDFASGQPLPGTDSTVAGWGAVAASFTTEDTA